MHVRLVAVETGLLVAEIPDNVCPVWLHNGKYLATVGQGTGQPADHFVSLGDGPRFSPSVVNVWEVIPGAGEYATGGRVSWLSFSPDGERLSANGAIWRFLRDGDRSIIRPASVETNGDCAAFCRNGQLWTARLRNSSTARTENELEQLAPASKAFTLPEPDIFPAESLDADGKKVPAEDALTPEGKLQDGIVGFAAGDPAQHVLNDGRNVPRDQVSVPEAFAFSNDGHWFVAACQVRWRALAVESSGPSYLDVWNLVEAKRVATIKSGRSRCLRFSPDGRLVASAELGLVIRDTSTWKIADGWQPKSYSIPDNPPPLPESVVFSPDSKIVVFDSRTQPDRVEGAVIKIAEVQTGRELGVCTGDLGRIHALAIGGEGQLLASGGEDRTIRLWAVPSGRELAFWEAHEDAVSALAFSPDGRTLVSASGNVLAVWDLPTIRQELSALGLEW